MGLLDIEPLGERAIRIGFGEEVSLRTQQKIQVASKMLEEANFDFIEHSLPSYTALTIVYNPIKRCYSEVKKALNETLKEIEISQLERPPYVEIPVCYGENFGPDLQDVADYHAITQKEVIDWHSKQIYPIFMIGFAPGFPYLGGLIPELYTPRLSNPRTHVEAGSVGIGGKQTGIYPVSSPGGWRIIGRTPVSLFNKEKEPPVILQAGMFLKFQPIDLEEYKKLKALVEQDEYQLNIQSISLEEIESKTIIID
ncbi:5-oxoprolinase subunit PxpB [Alkalihalobacillus trypoxylicola]|uniref:Carboxyltransferase domain-containing protein n=1 Tax=Alkalihalobacillus trypoxylicola TaxID=519424 RepID=A0A162ETZ9_9BACI|nr:5-oxoprolinase subunit PxpB [Alkalihalobacillus trypoxylicola]KYG33723.1 hypothetical protein AZF04_15985 [Alkalihalobacillus trypoxylicola]